jgi:hypothetical protein
MDEVKMFLFARWIATCYADEYLDEKMRYTDNEDFDGTTAMSVLNRESDNWYKEQLKHFNDVVYPNYVKNGSVDNAKAFFNVC